MFYVRVIKRCKAACLVVPIWVYYNNVLSQQKTTVLGFFFAYCAGEYFLYGFVLFFLLNIALVAGT